MGALAKTGCYPFSTQREGLVLGEGAAVLVLESGKALSTRLHDKNYGQILGSGFSTDASHITAPDPQQRGSRTAVNHCLRRSHLQPVDIGYIHPHGTGTALNDAHEAALIQAMFPNLPLISSSKGATGHSLGASGAMGTVFSLLALRHQVVPPNIGLQGEMIYPNLVKTATPHPFHNALCFSFGFGGQNAVLALGRT